MIPLLLWIFFVGAIYLVLRPHVGRHWLLPLVSVAAVAAGVALSAERISFRAGLIDARENPIWLLIWAGLIAAIVLTLRALVERSWLAMWLAAVGTLPLLLAQVGGYTFAVTCLQLAAAVALRRGTSAAGWIVCLSGGLSFWVIVVDPLSLGEPTLIPGSLLLPLLLLALFLPLVPPNLAGLFSPHASRRI